MSQTSNTPRGMLIRAQLLAHGVQLADIARDLGLSKQAVSLSVYGTYKYKGHRIRAHIAKLLGKSVAELWPESTA